MPPWSSREKTCSQLMKVNNTGETNIRVVGKYFRLTFVFNALKTSLNLYLNSFKTCLEGGNLVNLTMHAPWCITGCPFNIFYQTTCKGHAWGAAKALFCRNIMEACESREYGSDSKWKRQVEGAIMQAKEWTRTFGPCVVRGPVDGRFLVWWVIGNLCGLILG
jgi:hypothetical protein